MRSFLRGSVQKVARAVPATVNAMSGQSCLLLFAIELRKKLHSPPRMMVFRFIDGRIDVCGL
ncbi:hypothetical protein D3C79_871640 [compost metagenome]